MLRKIKYVFLSIVIVLIGCALLKDKIFDTPQKSKARIASFLQKTAGQDIATNVFNTNKTCVYKLYYWSIIPMGELKFVTAVNDLGNTFAFQATTKGNFIEKFVRAQAEVKSYFSSNIQLPYKYTEITQVNGKEKTKEILFDQANLVMSRGDRRYKIPQDTYDPISAFVRMLTLPIDKNEREKIKFVSGEDVYLFKSELLGLDAGIAEIRIDMRRENMSSNHGATFRAWVTDDSSRIPLAFKSWTPAGYFTVVLDRITTD